MGKTLLIQAYKGDLITVGDFAEKAVGNKTPQLVPNPFNPEVAISFGLGEPTLVRIDVFDIRGRFVAGLVDRIHGPGDHSVKWNGRDSNAREMPSGEYLFRVAIDGRMET